MKLVVDALNRSFYRDDRQLIAMAAVKGIALSSNSRTVVKLLETTLTAWP